MQKWEYKLIEVFNEPTGSTVLTHKQQWVWEEDGKRLTAMPNMVAKAKDLGYQGWELVSVFSAGAPVHMYYWFKRPMSEGVPPLLPAQ